MIFADFHDSISTRQNLGTYGESFKDTQNEL